MKTLITITDLTYMKTPFICIAGYMPTGLCVRPVLASKHSSGRTNPLYESFLWRNNQVVVRPFAVVELDLIKVAQNVPPHTEDWIIDPDHRVM